MGRIRTIKPDFFRSRSLARCSLRARLTYAGLWCEADDAGRGVADPRLLKGVIWPLDDDITPADIRADLIELADTAHIIIFAAEGDVYFQVSKWQKHQSAAYRRGDSKHPAPPENEPPPDPRTILHDSSCKEVQENAAGHGDGCKEVLYRKGEDAPGDPVSAAPPVDKSKSSSSSFEDTVDLYVRIVADFPRNVGKDSSWRRGVANNCRREHGADIRERLANGGTPVGIAERLAGVKLEQAASPPPPADEPPHDPDCPGGCEGEGWVRWTDDTHRGYAKPCDGTTAPPGRHLRVIEGESA